MNEKPENYWEPEVHRLRTHLDKVIDKDITDIVATTVATLPTYIADTYLYLF